MGSLRMQFAWKPHGYLLLPDFMKFLLTIILLLFAPQNLLVMRYVSSANMPRFRAKNHLSPNWGRIQTVAWDSQNQFHQ
jgi:hypothetical protein